MNICATFEENQNVEFRIKEDTMMSTFLTKNQKWSQSENSGVECQKCEIKRNNSKINFDYLECITSYKIEVNSCVTPWPRTTP